MAKINRRNVLKGLWVTPVITHLVLPTHAQTSCSPVQVTGQWQLLFGDQVSGLPTAFDVFLNLDGTTDAGSYTWSLSNNRVEIRDQLIPDAPIYSGELSSDCASMSGDITYFTPPPNNSIPFFGVKIQ